MRSSVSPISNEKSLTSISVSSILYSRNCSSCSFMRGLSGRTSASNAVRASSTGANDLCKRANLWESALYSSSGLGLSAESITVWIRAANSSVVSSSSSSTACSAFNSSSSSMASINDRWMRWYSSVALCSFANNCLAILPASGAAASDSSLAVRVIRRVTEDLATPLRFRRFETVRASSSIIKRTCLTWCTCRRMNKNK